MNDGSSRWISRAAAVATFAAAAITCCAEAFGLPPTSAAASDASVEWEIGAANPPRRHAYLEARLRYRQCQPKTDVDDVQLPGINVIASTETPSLLFAGKTLKRGAVQTFLIWCEANSRQLTLPPLTVATSAGTHRVPPLDVALKAAAPGMATIDAPSFLRASPNRPDRQLWQGELLALSYTLEGRLLPSGGIRTQGPSLTGAKQWVLTHSPAPGSKTRFRWDFAVRIPEARSVELEFEQPVEWQSGGTGATHRARLTTLVTLTEVYPLPSEPPSFRGAIGRFELKTTSDTGRNVGPRGIAVKFAVSGRGVVPAGTFPRPESAEPLSVVETEPPREVWLTSAEQRSAYALQITPRASVKILLGWTPFCYFDPSLGKFFEILPPAITIGNPP